MIGRTAISGVSGIVFGAGLALGGMTDPARVRGFLDLFGDWDPTLAFVMGAALLVMVIGWRLLPAVSKPLVAEEFHLPDKSDLTPSLLGGSAIFGIGWGIAGLCPGPAIANFHAVPVDALVFCVSMAAGMAIYRFVFDRPATEPANAA